MPLTSSPMQFTCNGENPSNTRCSQVMTMSGLLWLSYSRVRSSFLGTVFYQPPSHYFLCLICFLGVTGETWSFPGCRKLGQTHFPWRLISKLLTASPCPSCEMYDSPTLSSLSPSCCYSNLAQIFAGADQS